MWKKIQFSFAVSVTERVWGYSSHCADPDSVHALGHYNTPKHHCAHYIQETGGIWGLHACFSDADYSVKVKWYLQVRLIYRFHWLAQKLHDWILQLNQN